MSVRHVARRVVVSIAATAAAGSFAALAFAVPAAVPAAAASTACAASGDQCLHAAQAVPPFTAGTPFSSGQNIDVVVPANSAFNGSNSSSAINVVECAAPNGVIPTLTSSCDTLTAQPGSVIPNSDGSFTLSGYTVYALPDTVSLGESPGGQPACGNTLATECILYIGNNQGDFTQPHLWSQPFLITANGSDNGANPGDGTPEVPFAVLLPVSAMGLLGATVLVRRRRHKAPVA